MQDGPLREFDLLRLLDDAPREFGLPEARHDAHALYRAHFILFHALYRLRDELWAARAGHLAIDPLAI
ncbi:MAG TPA: molecular chaperone DnaJ, partial [Thioalkalivibrio sp.]|nr:molecular chaperone DnaJ [Thioalkalivibrio sp.]